jgi:PKD repeat protein
MRALPARHRAKPLMGALFVCLLAASASAGQQRGVVTAATISPASAQVGTPVTVSVTGKNPCGAVHIDWGDGTALTYAIEDLTTTQKHTYETPGNYAIVARGMGNCDGGTTLKIKIDPAPGQPDRPQLSSFTVSIPGAVGSSIGVTAHGRGTCRMTVDFGDGKSQELNVPLPHTVRHVYSAHGTFNVVANATAPCEGRHSVKMDVGDVEPKARLLGLKITPNPAPSQSRVAFTVDGRGTCPITVDFGDGTDQQIKTLLPAQISHTYARPGRYEVFAWAEAPCGGEATGSVRVSPRRR